ncbi:flavin-containing monooxygenase [Microbacterium abyssi]|uniref:flavin-containing monooxygenase n=1 Tax=Microbacterium abyssi TaxID=2782166 RepID=UPI0018877EBC|nr:NAD(P)/FAD-dependent oxidoreductase [Microbacterium sp. A18JL241]
MARTLSHRRVIIVGSGQAGLAVAAALKAQGLEPQRDFAVIDAAPQGHRSWANRWHSMVLLSDARHSALPAFPFPGDQSRYPRADEMLDYLASVEAELGVRTAWGVQAQEVTQIGVGFTLHLSTSSGDIQTRNVVCATGAATVPRIPAWSRTMLVPGLVLHSSEYEYPAQIPPGSVLIVGGGNSGVQLAEELCSSHDVTLSSRTRRRYRAREQYASAAGPMVPWLSRVRRPEPVFGDHSRLPPGIVRAPAVVDAGGASVTFADGSQMEPTSVILATGYAPGDSWLPEQPSHKLPRTKTNVPGLFVAGMPSHSVRGADTITGAWRDALTIAHQITDRP